VGSRPDVIGKVGRLAQDPFTTLTSASGLILTAPR